MEYFWLCKLFCFLEKKKFKLGNRGTDLKSYVYRISNFSVGIGFFELPSEKKIRVNPVRTGGGGGGVCVFHQVRGFFLPITLEVIKVHSRNFVTFPKILCQIR